MLNQMEKQIGANKKSKLKRNSIWRISEPPETFDFPIILPQDMCVCNTHTCKVCVCMFDKIWKFQAESLNLGKDQHLSLSSYSCLGSTVLYKIENQHSKIKRNFQ